MGLSISAGSSLRPAEVIISELRCKGTTFFKRFQAYSFPFKNCSESMDFTQVSFIPVQARSKVLCTYVQAPSGRTSLPPKDVRA